MKEMLLGSWRTTLLAVCLLIGLLMFTQGKISAMDFLAIMGFFNVAGFLLARDARPAESLARADLEAQQLPAAQRQRRKLVDAILLYLLLAFVLTVLGLCFYPLMRDAFRETPTVYPSGSGAGLYQPGPEGEEPPPPADSLPTP